MRAGLSIVEVLVVVRRWAGPRRGRLGAAGPMLAPEALDQEVRQNKGRESP